MSRPKRTENEILFDCQVDIINNKMDYQTLHKILDFIYDYRQTQGVELNNNFSHDNWRGIIYWAKHFKEKEVIRAIPLIGWHTIHPINFISFFYMKYPLIGFIFLPIITLDNIISLLRVYKNGRIDTSGKILIYFMNESYNLRLNKLIANYLVKRNKELGSWARVFEIYFPKTHRVYKAWFKN